MPLLPEETKATSIAPFNHEYGLRLEVRAGNLKILEKTWEYGKRQVIT
jgi:hypothetical protein